MGGDAHPGRGPVVQAAMDSPRPPLPRLQAPTFHVAPESGWINDPNGPLYWNGAYHMFYQHLPGSAVWGFNLVWGHSTSKDLVNWEVMPHAIEPTPGGLDGDGCFSGCAALDVDGLPVLLYTGVRLRGSALGGPLPPPECDLELPFIESQCIVYAEDPYGDWRLPYWRKSDVPFLALPPPGIKLAGWRDPYIVGPPGGHPEHGYSMLLGSGIKEQGGTVLIYRSRNLSHGWELAGEICSGLEADGTGIVWECPLLIELPLLGGHGGPDSGAPTRAASPGIPLANGVAQCNPNRAAPRAPDLLSSPFGAPAPGVPGSVTDGDAHTTATLDSSSFSSATGTTHGYASSVGDGGGVADGAQQERGEPSRRLGYRRRHFFCISPDACTNPTLYYLGDYVDGCDPDIPGTTTNPAGPAIPSNPAVRQSKFLITDALGPFRLDLGDILYAPNTMMDPTNGGRVLLWAWLQEARKTPGTYSYAGCLGVPRELWLEYGDDPATPRLVQRAVPEVAGLRLQGRSWVWPPPAPQPPQSQRTRTASLSGKPRVTPHAADPGGNEGAASQLGTGAAAATGAAKLVSMSRAPSQPIMSPFQAQDVQQSMRLKMREENVAEGLLQGVAGDDEVHADDPPDVPDLVLTPGQAFALPLVEGDHLDIEVQLQLVWPGEGDEAGSAAQLDAAANVSGGGVDREASSSAAAPEADEPALDGVDGAALGRVGPQEPQGVPVPSGARSGVVLRAWQAGAEGAAAILYCWSTQVLEVVFEALDPDTHEFSLAAPGCRRVGGRLQAPPEPGQPLNLRLLIDHSLLEVFTGSGEVLCTRVYRGTGPPGEGAGVSLVSLCCSTRVVSAAAYEMRSCWVEPSPLPLPAVPAADKAGDATAAGAPDAELSAHASLLQLTGALLQERGWGAPSERLVRLGSQSRLTDTTGGGGPPTIRSPFISDILSRMSSDQLPPAGPSPPADVLAGLDTLQLGWGPGSQAGAAADNSGGLSTASSIQAGLPTTIGSFSRRHPRSGTQSTAMPQSPAPGLAIGADGFPMPAPGLPRALGSASALDMLMGDMGDGGYARGNLRLTGSSPSQSLLAAETGELWSSRPGSLPRTSQEGVAVKAGSRRTTRSTRDSSPVIVTPGNDAAAAAAAAAFATTAGFGRPFEAARSLPGALVIPTPSQRRAISRTAGGALPLEASLSPHDSVTMLGRPMEVVLGR